MYFPTYKKNLRLKNDIISTLFFIPDSIKKMFKKQGLFMV